MAFAFCRLSSKLQSSSQPTDNGKASDGGGLRRGGGEAVPKVRLGKRLRRWSGAVAALGLAAIAPACLAAAIPAASNPTPVSFGSQAVGSAQAQTTVTFTVTSGGTLAATPLVLTTGAANLDYTLGTGSTCVNAVTSGTCTVNVVFTPRAPGQRLGAVQLTTSAGTTVATALLYGTGTGPAVVFPGNTSTATLGSGFSSPGGVAVDAAGDVYVADSSNNAVKEMVAVGGSIPASPTIRTLGSGFSVPTGVAVDGAGNVYVGDYGNSAVKEMVAVGGSIPASSPTIRTLGSGFSYPTGVAVDGAGNVYVADSNNNAVKEIVAVSGSIPASSPTIRTLGSGFSYPTGVAVDGAGNVYVADSNNNAVKEIVAVSGSIPSSPTIRTLGSGFSYPFGVAVDGAGNVYVAGPSLNAVKEIVAVGGSIPASSPTILTLDSGFSSPFGVAVDGAGNVYVADTDNSSVKEIPVTTPPSLSFATTSVGNTSTDSPQTLTVQNIGNTALSFPIPVSGTNAFISANYTIGNSGSCPQLTPSSGAAGTLTPGTCTETVSFTPVMPATAAGSLIFTDNSENAANATQTVVLNGTATAATGTTAQTISFTQPATPSQAGTTASLTASSNSNLAILFSVVSGPATVSGATVTYTGAGTVVLEADQYGNDTYAAAAPVQRTVTVQESVGVSGGTGTVTVTITTAGTLGAIDVLTTGQPNLDYTFVAGGTCAVGTMYAANATCTVDYNFTPKAPGQRFGAVQLVDSTGAVVMGTTLLTGTGTGPAVVFPGNTTTNTLGSGFSVPTGVAVDGAGNVYVADGGNSAVKEMVAVGGSIPASSPTIRTLGSGFDSPQGVAVDGAGDVYVADYGLNAVKEMVAVGGSIPSSPTILTLGSGFSGPYGVAVDGAGDVYVADSGNSAVKEMVAVGGSIPASSPTIRTLGSGFSYPTGVAVDGAGNVYVADSNNNAVKEIVAVSGSIPSSPTIRTLGSGFSYPFGVAVDGAGNVYVADLVNSVVKEMVAVGGSIPASSPTILTLGSGFSYPRGVAVDGAGNVYVADTDNSAVKEIPVTTPPSLSFASTDVGQTSAAQTLLVQNMGNAALNFPAPGTGSNPSISAGFVLGGSSTCPQVATGGSVGMLAPGTCTDSISFAPVMSGSISGSLMATDDSLGATSPYAVQTVPLSGMAVSVTPTVTGISPTSGPVAGGTTVTIAGTGFTGATVVDFGGTPASSFTVVSDTSVTAVSPAGAGGPVDVTVTTGYGTSATSAADVFSYIPPQLNYTAPTEPVGTASGTETATLVFQAAATLNSTAGTAIGVVTQGLTGYDFNYVSGSTDPAACTAGASYAAGASCTVTYSFTPKATGLRLGAAVLRSNAATPAIVATAFLSGTGTGPLATITPGVISTVAGTGTACTSANSPCGDGGAATSATLNEPVEVAVDPAGNQYIAELESFRLRKVTAGGVISTIAGNGTGCEGTCGDGGLAVNAEVTYLQNVALDGAGNVYFTETEAHEDRVRRIDAATGIITNFAGVPGMPGAPTINGPAASSKLGIPDGIAIDGAGNVYIADAVNYYIYKVPAQSGLLTVYAGTGVAGNGGNNGPATSATVDGPAEMRIDANGTLYFADFRGNVVRKITSGGTISLVAGTGTASSTGDGGLATAATLNAPNGVAVDAAGNVYIPEGNDVRKVLASTGIISTIAGGINAGYGGDGGPSTAATLNAPSGVTIDTAGNLYIADQDNNKIRFVALTSNPAALTFATTSVGSTSSDSPKTVTVTNSGNLPLAISAEASSSTSFPLAGACTSSTSLTAGQACTAGASFTPQTAGTPLTGTLTITDNTVSATGTVQTINLSGDAAYATPTVTGISPTGGPASGGTSVVITGTNFTGATAVDFGATAASSFTVVSDTSVTAVSPAGSAGMVDVTVTTPGGTSATSSADQFTYAQVFSATNSTLAISPSPAVAGSGVTVTATVKDTSGNAIPGATVTFGQIIAGGAASTTASFSNVTATNSSGVATATLTDTAAESLTVSASVGGSAIAQTQAEQFVAPAYVVTVNTDEATGNGVAANCVDPNISASGNTNCSLRDAVAAANALTGVTTAISFSGAAVGTAASPAVIEIAQATPITVTQNVSVNGPGANLLTVEGGTTANSSSNNRVLEINSGTVAISGLTLANGYGSVGGGGAIYSPGSGALTVSNSTFSSNTANGGFGGGAIFAQSTLTVSNSTFSGNTVDGGNGGAISAQSTLTVSNSTFSGNFTNGGFGGAISAQSTLTVSNSTFSGNTVEGGFGGAIYAQSTLTVSNGTFSGNTANAGAGGAIFAQSTLTVSNSTFSGNTANGGAGGAIYASSTSALGTSIFYGNVAQAGADCSGSCTFAGEITSDPDLAPLGNYGGPTQTMLPLPGSSAICAGTQPSLNGTPLTTDQRGVAISPTRYGQTACYDIGSVQTEYALAFTTSPGNALVGANLSPTPVVTLSEDGTALTAGSASIAMSAAAGTLSGTATQATSTTAGATAGQASFPGLSIGTVETGDTLTGTLALNGAIGLTATSSSFNVTQITATVAVSNETIVYGASTASLSASVSYTAGFVPTGAFTFQVGTGSTVTASCTVSGTTSELCTATYPSSGSLALTVGSYTITGTLAADTSYTQASGTGTLTVNQATPTVTVQNVTTAFGTTSTTLTATVSYTGMLAPTGAFTFTVGASPAVTASCTAATATTLNCTAAYPTASFTVAGSPYTITGTLAADTNYNGASGTGAITVTTITPGISVSPVTIAYGTASATLSATVTYTGTGAVPSGAFTFQVDSGATVTAACTGTTSPRTCTATYTTNMLTGGSHTIHAAEAADANYNAAAGTGTLTVTAITPGIAVSPVTIAYGTASTTLSATVTYTGTGAVPTGAFTFNVDGGAAVTAACTGAASPRTCTATYATNTLTGGAHAINAAEAADANYNAATGTGTLTVTAITPGILVSPVTIAYGTASATLSATVTYTGTGAVPSGAFTFNVDGGASVTAACTGATSPRTCTATYATNTLTGGAHAINAAEAADANYNAAAGTGTLTVTAITPGISVSPVTIAYGTASTTLSAMVTYTGTGAAPSGAFTFQVDSGATVTAACTGAGSPRTCTATYTTNALTGGAHTINAAQAADANYNAATGAGTLTVTAVTPGISVSPVTIGYGTASATLSATVTYTGTGAAPSGAFTFNVDGGAAVTAACTGAASPRTCTATYTTNTLTGGAHTINAAEAADANYNAAAGTGTLTVTATTPAITVPTVAIAYSSSPTTLTASVAFSGSLAPSGAVTFQVDAGAMVTGTCTGGASPETCTASYNTSATTGGSHTITVGLAADANYNASSGSGTLTVSMIAPTIVFTVPNHTYGDAPFAVTATSNSTGAFTYTVLSGPATISGNTVTLHGVGTVTIEASEAADTNYTTGSKTTNFNVAQAILTVSANNATRYYGAANPVFTGTITDQQYGDTFTESFLTTAATTSAPGAYAIVPAAAGADLSDYAVTIDDGTLTVTKAPTVTTVTASASPVNPTQAEILTASVASTTSGIPTGSVTFYANGTALATMALTGGTASYTTTTLTPAQTSLITAIYSGDADFLASTSAPIQVTVGQLDFTFTTTGATAYTAAPGTVASYTFQLAPLFGTYAGPVTFSVTGLPAGATASFTPASVGVNGGTQTVVMSVQTAKPLARNQAPASPFQKTLPMLALLLLPLGYSHKLRRKLGTRLLLAVVMLAGLGGAAALTGCGSGRSGFLLENPAAYTLTVTATAGDLQHSQTVTLIVQ